MTDNTHHRIRRNAPLGVMFESFSDVYYLSSCVSLFFCLVSTVHFLPSIDLLMFCLCSSVSLCIDFFQSILNYITKFFLYCFW